MLDDDPPLHGWLDIVMLAQRLGTGPSLLPETSADRALAIGISAEICAPYGFGWSRRLVMMDRDVRQSRPPYDPGLQTMMTHYHYGADAVIAARQRLKDIMGMLADRLRTQKAAGSAYLVGGRISTADYHWACFSQMVAPLPISQQPAMPATLAARYDALDDDLRTALDPILLAHRDHIFADHIGLPLEF